MKTENQLVTIEKKNALDLFTTQNGLDPVIQNIRVMLDDFKPDTSTAKGRSEIASIAHSVARSKTYLDNIGKELVSKLKEQPKLVDAERKRIRDLLDSWKEEVRAPLTNLEQSEKDCSDKLQSYLDTDDLTADEIKSRLDDAKSIDTSFAVINQKMLDEDKERVVKSLQSRYERQYAFEKQQKELERIRIENEERERKEREEAMRKEAAEQARIEAEQRAEREREAEQRKVAAEREAAERRELELKLQAEAAERRAAEAAEQERRRIEQERQEEQELQRKAAANKEHRKRVNNEILSLLTDAGLSDDHAKKVITMAAKGKSGRLTINY